MTASGNKQNSLESNDLLRNIVLQMRVFCKDKNWMIKRSQEDLVGFDRQIHRYVNPFHATNSLSIPPENIRKPLVF